MTPPEKCSLDGEDETYAYQILPCVAVKLVADRRLYEGSILQVLGT
jgi:hypothetical protein